MRVRVVFVILTSIVGMILAVEKIEADMRSAISGGELGLHFQPQNNTVSVL